MQVSYALDRCLAFWCLASGGEGQAEEQQGKGQQLQKWSKGKAFCGSMPCLGGFPYYACASVSGECRRSTPEQQVAFINCSFFIEFDLNVLLLLDS